MLENTTKMQYSQLKLANNLLCKRDLIFLCTDLPQKISCYLALEHNEWCSDSWEIIDEWMRNH